MSNLPYDRRDYEAIFEYLKIKAQEVSGGNWSDFSNGDIGTVILKLISYLADMNNYQIDKGLAELYIDSLTERDSAISLTKLIGYEPRGYKSARVNIHIEPKAGQSVEDGKVISRYTRFTDKSRNLSFCNLTESSWLNNQVDLTVYEGTYTVKTFDSSTIDSYGRMFLNEYNVDFETITITIAGDIINQVENALTDISNNVAYSVHIGDNSNVYIQFPSYYNDFIPSNSAIQVEYLLTKGKEGSIGSYVIESAYNDGSAGLPNQDVTIYNNLASTGAEDPETIEEIQKGAPLFASTMNTLVTLEDIQLARYEVPGIADIIALDYNSPESGLIQPADAYKVNLYVLPTDLDYIIDPGENLTDVGKKLKEYIDAHRLTSIMISYNNVEILTPDIKIEAYINKYDLRADSLADKIKQIILKNYDRSVFKIGEGIYSSKLSKQILDEIDYCNYIEVQLPDDSYIPTKMQFLKVQLENIEVTVIEE